MCLLSLRLGHPFLDYKQHTVPHCPRVHSPVHSPTAPCVHCRHVRGALLITQSPEKAFLSGLFTKNSCASDELPHFCLEWTEIM